ncbi:MAG: hypothetical protein F2663_01735 [Actinobacteria bacterium]|uniref:Unannotated protein n=1 Tax=freshwater metagenome TaxID=449393 RepID=A0A6J6NPS6_9ZZZZ|nr:hypothetical protein [Actinomycetota bacterium]
MEEDTPVTLPSPANRTPQSEGRLPRIGRTATANTAVAAALAAIIAFAGPPGADLAAHVFQRDLFLEHGFALWTNYWYAGRYTFVGYSLLYYPLAAFLGIALLAVLSVALATWAFTVLAEGLWGRAAVLPSRLFAIVAAASVITAAFPYGLGLALALCALVAVARGRLTLFSVLAVLTFGASPLAFLFLLIVLGAVALSRSEFDFAKPAAVLGVVCLFGALLWRLFPDGGRFPFSTPELLAVMVFCLLGLALTWGVDKARILTFVFAAYAAACLLAYAVPSSLGENVVRLRFIAIPIAALTLSLRRWQPLPVAIAAFGLALSWNATPLAFSFVRSSQDPSASAAYWSPAVSWLSTRLTPSYRVEAVDTSGHWEAVYLAKANIPIVRGWFRQDDFPQNEVLYDPMGRKAYLDWLHQMGVRYVVLTDAPTDYSAADEASLLRSGRSRLPVVFRSAHLTIYRVPGARPIIAGPGNPSVTAIGDSNLTLLVRQPGRYRLALRFTPYLTATDACLSETAAGMTIVHARRAGLIDLDFNLSASGALAAISGSHTHCSEPG